MTKTHQDHCENCGSTDREDLATGDQGYTACCNQLICDGRTNWTWQSGARQVQACCGHTAGLHFKVLGIHEYWR